MSKQRILLYDTARALCAIHIIVLWHGIMYFFPESLMIKIGSPITVATLACFTFLSGLFNNASKGTYAFYLNRLKRLYVPFAISYFALIFIGFNKFTLKDTLLSLTGISCFLGGQPNTLWYICMLLIFYALTPYILFNCDKKCISGKIAARGLIVFLIFTLCDKYMPNFETRILYYFPFYILGLLTVPEKLYSIIHLQKHKYLNLLAGIFLFGLTFLLSACLTNELVLINIGKHILLGFFGTILILLVAEKQIGLLSFPKQVFDKNCIFIDVCIYVSSGIFLFVY